jgi:ornithine carbamoyltransferase
VTISLSGRPFLKELDFTKAELHHLLSLAAELKAAKRDGREVRQLEGKAIALVFEKTSTRTRCAFEVSAYDQGAHVTYLDPQSSQMGHKESVRDTARVLGRMFDAIEYRGSAQTVVEELALYAGVPVYNGLTDEWHPTQMLADFLTMAEHRWPTASPDRWDWSQLSYAYLGDARSNMGNSLLVMGALMGSDVRICGPRDLWPAPEVVEAAQSLAATSGARVLLTDDPAAALPGAHFVHTDVWVSMGEPAEVWDQRVHLLSPYQVNAQALAATANPQVKFMHCLPAFHDTSTTVGHRIADQTGMTDGLEVTDEVFESAASVVFDQAENRLHTIKAVLCATLG